jgi:putative membrane protein
MVSTKVLGCIAGLVGLVLGAGTTVALLGPSQGELQQPSGTSAAQHSSAAPISDADFARDAAEGGMAEVKLGQLASDKGQSITVKDFGKRMVNDHNASGNELSSIATREKLSLPGDLSKRDQALYNQLSKMSGAAFDRAYARLMVRDHANDVSEFNTEASNGRDQNLKDFAQRTLPTLEEHLKLAREMLRAVSRASGASGQSGLSR